MYPHHLFPDHLLLVRQKQSSSFVILDCLLDLQMLVDNFYKVFLSIQDGYLAKQSFIILDSIVFVFDTSFEQCYLRKTEQISLFIEKLCGM